MRKIIFVLPLIFSAFISFAQTSFYDINTIQRIELFISQPNWDFQLDTLKTGSDGYLMIDSAKVNGVSFRKPGLKYKGNSSYDPNIVKNPFHISLDRFVNNNYQGYTSIKLSNGYADPSMIREVLSYAILRKYMHCSGSNFAKLYINGVYWGIYSNDEDISKTFCANKFASKKTNTFFKANPMVIPSTNTKSNLKFISSDSTSYFNFYEIKSTRGWKELVALCDTVSNNNVNIEKFIDMDKVLWMLAFNSVTVNLDSYSGAFCQNYYLFKDNNGLFNPIVWDLNMAFGGFAFVGVSNSSLGALTVQNMQNLTPAIHANDPYWPLINIVLNNDNFKKRYYAHIRTMLEENFANNSYINLANELKSLIDADVLADNNKLYTYAQFQNGLTGDVNIGNYVVPGIQNLMSARSTYLSGFPDVQALSPLMMNTTQSNVNAIDSTVIITSNISNATKAWLYSKFTPSNKFVSVKMYDDGTNGDAIANDQVYTARIVARPGSTQYYVYAENADAGSYEPKRAAYEYYTVSNQVNTGITNDNSRFSVYPNPVSTILTIQQHQHKTTTIKLMDMFGKVLLEEVLNGTTNIDVSMLEAGMYFLQIDGVVKKIMVN